MKKTKSLYFFLISGIFFVTACAPISIPTPKIEADSPIPVMLPKALTATPTAIPSIPVTENLSKQSDATQWKHKLQGLRGKNYRYDNRDLSPDGHWFVSLDSTFLLRLTPLDSSPTTVEYQIKPEDIHAMWVYSWSPDSSAFMVCVNYSHNPNGCQAIKIFEILPGGVLKEHNIAWAGDDFVGLWYGRTVTFVSPNSGIFQFDYTGSLRNNSQMRFLVNSALAEVGHQDVILAVQRPYNLTTSDFLPSKIYEFNRRTLVENEIYKSEFPLDLLGSDSDAKLFLLEEFSNSIDKGLQSISINLFELETRRVIQRYVFPPDTRISRSVSGNNLVAFDVTTKDNDGKIWVFDFKTRRIDIRGSGVLMGWLYPNEGFLVSDKAFNWILLDP